MIKKMKLILVISVTMIIINFILPKYSYGVSGSTVQNIGGKLLNPIMELFVALCDGAIDISQKVLFGVDGDAIVEINRVGSWIAKALGIIAGIAVLAGCVALAVITAPVSGVAALVAVGVGTAILSIGKVVKTYFAVSTIVASMLPNSFQLPFIVISPENIIQNKIGMFSINFFEVSSNEQEGAINISDDLHEIIAKWYYAIRNLVIVLFMIVLLYIGLRIILTSISEEKVKYKQMLSDWLVSFCLLFGIHYIMIFSMYLVDEFTEMISEITNDESVEYFEIVDDKVYDYVKENLVDSDDKPSWFDEKLAQMKGKLGISDSDSEEYSTIYINDEGKKTVRYPVDNFLSQARIKFQLLDKDSNVETYVSVGWKIIYVMLTLYTIRFAWIYLKRVVYIAFLIIIAPLVILTYSIDRFKDGQAQGFNTWLREYLFNLAIQPLHLMLYTIFVGSAMSLASKSPIYVIVVLGFIVQAEKILRNMFNFQKASTPGVFGGAFGTGVAMSAAQKLFGRKPEQSHSNNYLKKLAESGDEPNSKIKEQDIDIGDILDDTGSNNFLLGGGVPIEKTKQTYRNAEDNNTEKAYNNKGAVHQNKRTYKKQIPQRSPIKLNSKSNKNNKKKIKFKLGKALKKSAIHYTQAKGRALANKTMNTDFIGGAKKLVLGGAAGLATGTAGVLLGAMDGSPEKAIRNGALAGTAAYKGVSNIVDSHKESEGYETFVKMGYGDDYKQHQNEVLAREIKNDLEKREKLKEEFDWDKDELNEFLSETINQYIDAGVKQFDDMVIGEKMKMEGIAKSTKEAIGIMSMAQKIGTDTTKLTEKKKQEWAETFMSRNSQMSKIQEEIKQRQQEYEKEISNILQKKLDKKDEEKQINTVKSKIKDDAELKFLNKNVSDFKIRTFEKLDKYSEYKYKG